MMYSLFEATLSQLKRKQQSIVRLFPDFFTNPIKVKGVIDKGGVRMSSMEGDTWQFSIHSGSEEGKWYDAHVRWKNIVPTIQNLVADRRNWNKAKTGIDLRKLSAKMFEKADVELDCTCLADTYYGKEYIRSQGKYRAQYGEPENRPPDKRNPKQYGAMCKHLQVLMRVLPFYKSTMANWLKKEYGDVIKEAEEQARTKAGTFQTAAQQLKRRRTKESLEEALSPSEKLQDLAEEEDLLRDDMPLVFFLLPSGKYVNVPGDHEVTASEAGTSIDQLLSDGTIRGFDDEDYLNLEIFHANQPTSQQWTTLRRAIGSSMGLLVDFTDGEFPEDTLRDDSGGSKAYRRLQNYYKGGDQSKSKTAQFHESIQVKK